MNVLTIDNSNFQLEWKKLNTVVKQKEELSLLNGNESTAFISDFPAPVDETSKTVSKSESIKSDKKSKPSSYTSENWIG